MSQIGFIDFSKEERNKVLAALRLLGDQTALDELGIGTLRDAYADLLFPGISTIQTRAKYFVLLPYLFQSMEQAAFQGKLKNGREALQWLHEQEDRLVPVLVKKSGPEERGIIGSNALRQKRTVKLKPSGIYWNGLRTFGILRDERISMLSACAAVVQAGRRRRETEVKTGGESFDDHTAADTGDALFSPIRQDYPFRTEAAISLTAEEAAYLEERITRSLYTKNSLMAFLLSRRLRCADFFSIPASELPADLRRDYLLAEAFSRFIYGAHVRYNVIFAAGSGGAGSGKAMEEEFDRWREEFLSASFQLSPILERGRCNSKLALFCRQFLESVRQGDEAGMDELITARERAVKGSRAKLRKPQEYRYDPDRPIHYYHLNFRFDRAREILGDIMDGLEGQAHV